jgi:hypothetical protein
MKKDRTTRHSGDGALNDLEEMSDSKRQGRGGREKGHRQAREENLRSHPIWRADERDGAGAVARLEDGHAEVGQLAVST